jgi:hypothetical protein
VRQDYLRLVRSGQLAMDACAGGVGDPVDCRARFHTVSASLGARRAIGAAAVKLDLSTASRPPNPDEQYLNGTAPTFPVLGLGKPDLGPETTYSATATIEYQDARVAAQASAYVNRIDDYVEFAPAIGADGRPIFDVLIRGTFPRFVTTGRRCSGAPAARRARCVAERGDRRQDRRDGSFLRSSTGSPRGGDGQGACLGPLRVRHGRRHSHGAAALRDLLRPGAPRTKRFLLGAELQGTCRSTTSCSPSLAGRTTPTRYRDYSLLRHFAVSPAGRFLRVTGRFGAAGNP